jgi:iron complex outermembrane recepter protein
MAGILARTTLRACGWWLLVGMPVVAATAAEPADLGPAPLPRTSAGDALPNTPAPKAADDLDNLLKKDIGELSRTPVVVAPALETHVSTVSRSESTVGRSPAAVFVITNEMIRRSGVTTIADALRMAPGMEVANINSNTWAISSRGFNDRYANKLLVMIDGRTVYSPVYSGVTWDVQDVLLEDVDRIEVIRGPGGTLWGANAVNGVISIITKKAKDTQGTYITAGGGDHERLNDAARYGGQLGENGYYRVYGKSFERGPGAALPTYGPADDAWRQGRVGFRADWDLDRCKTDTFTVQGDFYSGVDGIRQNQTLVAPPFLQSRTGHEDVTGGNLLARWKHVLDGDSDWTLQTYYDRFDRDSPLIAQHAATFDVDFQHCFPLGDRQKITWGAGFRQVHDSLISTDDFSTHFTPPERTYDTISQFAQDEIAVVEDLLTFTIGAKLEENDYTGLECQPSARLLWTPDKRQSVWGAVSRAVRTPARIDSDFFATAPPVFGAFPRILGNRDFESETLIAYELGYRAQPTERFSWDVAAFYNTYDRLRTTAFGTRSMEFVPAPPHMILPVLVVNGPRADTYGIELASNWKLSERWRLYGQYTYFQLVMYTPTGVGEDKDPHNQIYFRSSWDLRSDIEYDVALRYVDSLHEINVPAYITMDMRLAWRPRKRLEVAVVGQNLLQAQHQEYGRTANDWLNDFTAVPRGVYGTVAWRY